MSSTPDVMDIAKFQLDAFKTSVELQIKGMDVFGEYNVRMMEAAEKQMKIATDQFKLQLLQQAYLSFRAAQQEVVRRGFAWQQKLERYQTALVRVAYLATGESIPPMFIGIAWRGFWFLTSQAPVSAVVEMSSVKLLPAARKGTNFFSPGNPTMKCESAPASIKAALHLMDFARDRQYALRSGSAASDHLVTLLKILGNAAQEQKGKAESELKSAKEELTKLRELSWKSLDFTAAQPKKP